MNVIKTADLVYRPAQPLPKAAGETAKNDFGAYLKDALGEVN